ncbi:STAS domain-containing protein [Streptomyces sp. NPDC097619]|uniref:STAS domain-containing protein n=1 Tax=Streptomyces sp. NPDC097619 TaxID=3157228 RepID=UPI00331F6A56
MDGTGLRISRRGAPAGTCVLVVAGEVDYDTAPMLVRSLNAALAGPPVPDSLVVDCSGLTFCGSAGLNALLTTYRSAAEGAVAFALASPLPQLRRLLRMTGVEAVLPITDTPTVHP